MATTGRGAARGAALFFALAVIAAGVGWLFVGQPPPVRQTTLIADTVLEIQAGGRSGRAAVEAALARAGQLEQKFDRYRPDSVVARINAGAGGEWQTVDDDCWQVLTRGQQVAEVSCGYFDLTIGPLVDLWAIGKKNQRPDERDIAVARSLVDYRQLEMDSAGVRRVRLARPGMSIDLG
ncbi:MAG: FAD:protein FMN transferase, partial [Negativicutes bacterium]|nr:FAD:protein FMN transferase [Negativicutes bacterium]